MAARMRTPRLRAIVVILKKFSSSSSPVASASSQEGSARQTMMLSCGHICAATVSK
jgi:hypothetical protein